MLVENSERDSDTCQCGAREKRWFAGECKHWRERVCPSRLCRGSKLSGKCRILSMVHSPLLVPVYQQGAPINILQLLLGSMGLPGMFPFLYFLDNCHKFTTEFYEYGKWQRNYGNHNNEHIPPPLLKTEWETSPQVLLYLFILHLLMIISK